MSSSKAKGEAKVVYVRRVYGSSASFDSDFDAYKAIEDMLDVLITPAKNAENIFFAILKILFP